MTDKTTYLWKVTVQYQSEGVNPFTLRTTLNIITDTVSIKAAISRAQAFLKENRAEYRKAIIHAAEFEGSVDA